MLHPERPPAEARRLRALRALHLLDTPIEERFERITREARRQLRVPVAAVSLVDESRQWFKSERGLGCNETAREVSFCAHAILGSETFVVPDAARDRRFADSPLVTEDPGLRFYAGHPVRAPDGPPVGTLCVGDYRPRRFGARERRALRALARAVEDEFRAPSLSASQRRLVAELGAERRRLALDSLTRLWTRAAILEILAREFESVCRSRGTVGAIVADVDRCERVNREHGVEAGDAVIREAAGRIVGGLRAQDAAGRFGGEEFLGVAARADGRRVAELARRVRRQVTRAPMRTPAGPVRATVSVGAAWAPAAQLPGAGALLDAAEDALCRAQARGGNRVEVICA